MKFVKPVTAGLLAVLVQCVVVGGHTAHALTVSNRDDHDHKITIVEGQASRDHVLQPDGTLENVCPKGCLIRLNDSEDDEYELEGSEVVSIEDGYLYYDSPDATADPAPGPDKPGDGKGGGQK